MIKPPALVEGDKIGLIAPARKISREEIIPAVEIIREKGFVPVYNDELFAAHHQFAGDDEHRARYIQQMLDDSEIKAVFSVRGGYGSVRIVDMLDFTGFMANPKWFELPGMVIRCNIQMQTNKQSVKVYKKMS